MVTALEPSLISPRAALAISLTKFNRFEAYYSSLFPPSLSSRVSCVEKFRLVAFPTAFDFSFLSTIQDFFFVLFMKVKSFIHFLLSSCCLSFPFYSICVEEEILNIDSQNFGQPPCVENCLLFVYTK
jgi:hypothetical protein